MKIAHVILAGGNSEFLFPVTRENMPKQFKKYGRHNILNELTEDADVKSTFQETVSALESVSDNLFIITQEKYKFHVITQLKELGLDIPIIFQKDEENLKDAILRSSKINADKIIFYPSDQIVIEKKKFQEEIALFIKSIEEVPIYDGVILVTKNEPKKRFGYVLTEGTGRLKNVTDYIEKPDHPELLVNKGYLVSTGIVALSPETIQEKLPPIDYVTFLKKVVKKAFVANYKWIEVNTIKDLKNFSMADSDGNYRTGKSIVVDSKNNIIYNESPQTIITAGLEDLAIINVGDVSIILPKDKVHEYDKIIDVVKKKNPELFKHGITSYRPWGRYTNIFEAKNFKIKILELSPGASISLQKHYHRSEHWVVVSGTAKVILDGKEMVLLPGQSVFIPIGGVHQLINPGKIPLKVVEVQYGEYLEEDDIVRLKDVYGRVKE